MPHPWMCSRPGEVEHWATCSGGQCSFPWQGCCIGVFFYVLSDANRSVILMVSMITIFILWIRVRISLAGRWRWWCSGATSRSGHTRQPGGLGAGLGPLLAKVAGASFVARLRLNSLSAWWCPAHICSPRRCGAALGLKHCSSLASLLPSLRVRSGIPAGTRVRWQCPLVERGLKGLYKRVLGLWHLGLFLLMISTTEAYLWKLVF